MTPQSTMYATAYENNEVLKSQRHGYQNTAIRAAAIVPTASAKINRECEFRVVYASAVTEGDRGPGTLCAESCPPRAGECPAADPPRPDVPEEDIAWLLPAIVCSSLSSGSRSAEPNCKPSG